MSSEIVSHNTVFEITEKVSFNIASIASYVYILSGQKFNKSANSDQFWPVSENLKKKVKRDILGIFKHCA